MGISLERKCFYYGTAFHGRVDGIMNRVHEAGRASDRGDVQRAEREWEAAREFAQDIIPFAEKVKMECGVDYIDAVARIKKAVGAKLRWEVHHEVWDLTTELINWAMGLGSTVSCEVER